MEELTNLMNIKLLLAGLFAMTGVLFGGFYAQYDSVLGTFIVLFSVIGFSCSYPYTKNRYPIVRNYDDSMDQYLGVVSSYNLSGISALRQELRDINRKLGEK